MLNKVATIVSVQPTVEKIPPPYKSNTKRRFKSQRAEQISTRYEQFFLLPVDDNIITINNRESKQTMRPFVRLDLEKKKLWDKKCNFSLQFQTIKEEITYTLITRNEGPRRGNWKISDSDKRIAGKGGRAMTEVTRWYDFKGGNDFYRFIVRNHA